MTSGNDDVILAKKNGNAIRFNETDGRVTARATMGVKGIWVGSGDEVVEMVVVKAGAELLAVTENGFGKRTDVKEFRNQKRGGKGVICIHTGKRNGKLVTIKEVFTTDEVMMITKKGKIIKSPVLDVSVRRRHAKGVKLINLDDGDFVVDVTLMAGEESSANEEIVEKPEGTSESVKTDDVYDLEPEEGGEGA